MIGTFRPANTPITALVAGDWVFIKYHGTQNGHDFVNLVTDARIAKVTDTYIQLEHLTDFARIDNSTSEDFGFGFLGVSSAYEGGDKYDPVTGFSLKKSKVGKQLAIHPYTVEDAFFLRHKYCKTSLSALFGTGGMGGRQTALRDGVAYTSSKVRELITLVRPHVRDPWPFGVVADMALKAFAEWEAAARAAGFDPAEIEREALGPATEAMQPAVSEGEE